MSKMNTSIKYTKSDLQLSEDALLDAIIQVGKELEKSDTPRSRTLSKRLLSNFNNYDENKMSTMLKNFQHLLVECASGNEEGILDVAYVVEDKSVSLAQVIMCE